jgi:hypothetical protein
MSKHRHPDNEFQLHPAWIGAAIFVLSLPMTLPYIVTSFSAVGFWAIFGLDAFVGAHLLPNFPWIMWALAGALVGGCLGFWTVAPAYGLRSKRAIFSYAPFLVLVILMVFGLGAMNQRAAARAVQANPQTPGAQATASAASTSRTLKGIYRGTFGDLSEASATFAVQPEGYIAASIRGEREGVQESYRLRISLNSSDGNFTIMRSAQYGILAGSGTVSPDGSYVSGSYTDRSGTVRTFALTGA